MSSNQPRVYDFGSATTTTRAAGGVTHFQYWADKGDANGNPRHPAYSWLSNTNSYSSEVRLRLSGWTRGFSEAEANTKGLTVLTTMKEPVTLFSEERWEQRWDKRLNQHVNTCIRQGTHLIILTREQITDAWASYFGSLQWSMDEYRPPSKDGCLVLTGKDATGITKAKIYGEKTSAWMAYPPHMPEEPFRRGEPQIPATQWDSLTVYTVPEGETCPEEWIWSG